MGSKSERFRSEAVPGDSASNTSFSDGWSAAMMDRYPVTGTSYSQNNTTRKQQLSPAP